LTHVDERILLVEDDPSIREVTTLGLARAGFRVTAAADGREGLQRARRDPFDLVLLDVMLPTLDGFEICREIRKESAIPVIMLTAKADTTDVVVGLELGADDYVTKPFEVPELVARVRAVLRRSRAERGEPTIEVGDLEVDPTGFVARRGGSDLALTATEFRLLLELARHAGQVLTREQLLRRVWSYDYLGDSRLVDVAVQRLRSKVEDDPAAPRVITTVRGVGYRLERS
jgi:two-component system response regulator MtrA